MLLNAALVCRGLMLGSALLVSSLRVSINKCYDEMMDEIKEIQCDYGRPGCLLEQYSCKTWCKIYVTRSMFPTSFNYILTNFTNLGDKKGIMQIESMFADGTREHHKYTLTEKCGKMYVAETGYVRVPVYLDGGVAVDYVCDPSEDASPGPSALMIQVTTKSSELCPKSLERAYGITKLLGFTNSDFINHEGSCKKFMV